MGNLTARILFGLMLALVLPAAACQKGSEENPAAEQQSGGSSAEMPAGSDEEPDIMPYGPRYLSIVDFKGQYGRTPTALDIGREGNYAFFKLLASDNEMEHLICYAGLADSGARQPHELTRSDEFNIAYIAAHPSEKQCLVTSNYMHEDGHVHNRVWLVNEGGARELPYEASSGFPEQHGEEFLSRLEPFFSWDGSQVIVPVGYLGVVVMPLTGESGRYFALPNPKIEVTGWKCSTLPDSSLGRQIQMNVWEARSRDEKCRLFSLDLDSDEGFQLQQDVTWVVYRYSSPDLEYEPWMLRGSRLPDYLEDDRQARTVLLDPESGIFEDVEFGGEPEFNYVMNDSGTALAFMDELRQGLVRLDPASGEFSLDERWYSEKAQLFFAGADDRVFVWHRDILLEAFPPSG